MTDHDIQLLLLDLALIIALARLLGAAAKRIGQPPVVGEIIAGILLGRPSSTAPSRPRCSRPR